MRHDVIAGDATLEWTQDSGRHRYDDIDLTVHSVAADRFTIRPDDPLSARAEVAWTVRLARGDWRVETRTRTVLTATRNTFELVATLEALEDERPSTRSAGRARSPAIWSDPADAPARGGAAPGRARSPRAGACGRPRPAL